MKNKILVIMLTVFMIIGMTVSTGALDAPTPGGDHLFGPDRMMYYEPGTRWHNGIANGAVPHPINPDTFSTWQGVKFLIDTYKGEKCVKVELCEGYNSGYFDFNYYQWDALEYEPSLDCSKYPWLRVRYAYNDAAEDLDCMGFFASPDVDVLGTAEGAAQKTWDIANGEGEWMDTVVYLGDLMFVDGKTWEERTVRQFRIRMFEYNENPDAVCYIAGFGFFESEEAAMAYDFQTGESAVVTEAPTEAITEAPTEAVTSAETAVVTTEEVTEADATEETTLEDDTEEETTSDTEVSTEAASEEDTQAPTETSTEAPTEAETTVPVSNDAEEDSNNIVLPIAIVAAVVVIATVVIALLKKKKS